MSKLENAYQKQLIKKIEQMFPGCLIMKNDEQYRQGIPDLTILFKDRWAVLEVKRDEKELKKPVPNQDHYVERLDKMSFSSFIYPSNEKEVLSALQRTFGTTR